ncbi:hypothetical protein D3C79_856290 [compost metagenome]
MFAGRCHRYAESFCAHSRQYAAGQGSVAGWPEYLLDLPAGMLEEADSADLAGTGVQLSEGQARRGLDFCSRPFAVLCSLWSGSVWNA